MNDTELDQFRTAEVLLNIIGSDIKLKREGKVWKGICPFHTEKTGSFVVFDDGGWKCFGCNKHGDVFEYVKERHHVDFPRAKQIVADARGVTLRAKFKKPSGNGADPDKEV